MEDEEERQEGVMGSDEPAEAEPLEKDLYIRVTEIIHRQRPDEEKTEAITGLMEKGIDRDFEIGDLAGVKHSIKYGKGFNLIKKWVKDAKLKGGWMGFMDTHLSRFISERSIQNCMYLANNSYCHQYPWMGAESLLKAAKYAKKNYCDDDDPIGAFLNDIGVEPVPEGSRASMAVKKQIDDAIVKPHSESSKKSEVTVMPVPDQQADQLIDQLIESLADDNFLAKIDVTRLETLEEKIKEAMAKISES